MGDRANIKVVQSAGNIWFYTHWRGYCLPEILRESLAKKESWYDEIYLAATIFSEMTKRQVGDAIGISTTIQDNERPILVVDVDNQTVRIETDRGADDTEYPARFSFAQYVALGEATWGCFQGPIERGQP